jgi:hypothetical protein
MLNMGVSWEPTSSAHKDRENGWTEIKKRLGRRVGSNKDIPGLLISRECEKLLEVLPKAMCDQNNKDDLDKRQELHVLDALRYLCMGNPLPPEKPTLEDEVSLWERIVKKQAGGRTGKFAGYG